jgi:hypothetical protein
VDDLAVRLRSYHDMRRFVAEEAALVAAHTYATYSLPDLPELRATRQAQAALAARLRDPRPYIDSDVRMRTELLGAVGQGTGIAEGVPEAGGARTATGTFEALERTYAGVYLALHDNVTNRVDAARREIERLKASDDVRALEVLAGVSALRSTADASLGQRLDTCARALFTCPAPSKHSVETQLPRNPVHECGLSFENAPQHVTSAETAVTDARQLIGETLDQALALFLTPAVRQRLSQGAADPAIAQLLRCASVADLRLYLVGACLRDTGIVATINRYLKRVVVKAVHLADFKPASATIERDQIADVAHQFQRFLERELDSARAAGDADGDTLPVLRVE